MAVLTKIVRYMHRFGELDIVAIKESLKARDTTDILSPWPVLDFNYDHESDGLALFHNGYIVTREQLHALVAEIEQFYKVVGDEAVKHYNEDVRSKREDRNFPPVQPPQSPREFDKKPKSKPNSNINTRDCEPGYIYLMQDLDNSDIYKIGLARDVKRRRKQIGRVEVVHTILVDNMAQAEADLHKQFENQWLEGEWFKLQESDIEHIKSLVRYKGYKFISNEAIE